MGGNNNNKADFHRGGGRTRGVLPSDQLCDHGPMGAKRFSRKCVLASWTRTSYCGYAAAYGKCVCNAPPVASSGLFCVFLGSGAGHPVHPVVGGSRFSVLPRSRSRCTKFARWWSTRSRRTFRCRCRAVARLRRAAPARTASRASACAAARIAGDITSANPAGISKPKMDAIPNQRDRPTLITQVPH